MEIVVKGRNISVTEALERYAFEKVERVRKFFDDEHSVSRAEVELTHERNPSNAAPQVAEATLFINGSVLKAREASEDMYASIDRMSDKLERRDGHDSLLEGLDLPALAHPQYLRQQVRQN